MKIKTINVDALNAAKDRVAQRISTPLPNQPFTPLVHLTKDEAQKSGAILSNFLFEKII